MGDEFVPSNATEYQWSDHSDSSSDDALLSLDATNLNGIADVLSDAKSSKKSKSKKKKKKHRKKKKKKRHREREYSSDSDSEYDVHWDAPTFAHRITTYSLKQLKNAERVCLRDIKAQKEKENKKRK